MVHSPSAGVRRRDCLAWCCAAVAAPAWTQTTQAPDQGLTELASVWPESRAPQGFAVSEKFDGVRAVWDGRQLRFRSGRLLTSAPDWFLQGLPSIPLDGELWLGRGQFDALSGLVRSEAGDARAWQQVRYCVFDAPGVPGTFAQRWQHLRALPLAHSDLWQVVEQVSVDSVANLQARLRAVIQAGGEGLVLHRWDAPWRAGRSASVFKYKSHDDDEAEVVGYRPGQGKYAGLTGALLVRDARGRRFALGSGLSDALRVAPPPVGTWVTYRYQGLTAHGLPRFARFLRVRWVE
jgi:DNA ligase 1